MVPYVHYLSPSPGPVDQDPPALSKAYLLFGQCYKRGPLELQPATSVVTRASQAAFWGNKLFTWICANCGVFAVMNYSQLVHEVGDAQRSIWRSRSMTAARNPGGSPSSLAPGRLQQRLKHHIQGRLKVRTSRPDLPRRAGCELAPSSLASEPAAPQSTAEPDPHAPDTPKAQPPLGELGRFDLRQDGGRERSRQGPAPSRGAGPVRPSSRWWTRAESNQPSGQLDSPPRGNPAARRPNQIEHQQNIEDSAKGGR